MNPQLKNNQIPDTRCLHRNETPPKHPATHGALSLAPKKAGCKLLTLCVITFYLTKVNKIKCTMLYINDLKRHNIKRKLPPKPHYLTKNHLFISFFYALLLA